MNRRVADPRVRAGQRLSYDRCAREGRGSPSVSEDVEVKQECAAHHEAGNIAIAAVDGVT